MLGSRVFSSARERVSTVRFPFSISRTNRRESSSIESQASLPNPGRQEWSVSSQLRSQLGQLATGLRRRPLTLCEGPTADNGPGSGLASADGPGLDGSREPLKEPLQRLSGRATGPAAFGAIPRRLPDNRSLSNGTESRREFFGPVGVGGVPRPRRPER